MTATHSTATLSSQANSATTTPSTTTSSTDTSSDANNLQPHKEQKTTLSAGSVAVDVVALWLLR